MTGITFRATINEHRIKAVEVPGVTGRAYLDLCAIADTLQNELNRVRSDNARLTAEVERLTAERTIEWGSQDHRIDEHWYPVHPEFGRDPEGRARDEVEKSNRIQGKGTTRLVRRYVTPWEVVSGE